VPDELEQLRLGDVQDRRGFPRGVELTRDRLAGRACDLLAWRAERLRRLGGQGQGRRHRVKVKVVVHPLLNRRGDRPSPIRREVGEVDHGAGSALRRSLDSLILALLMTWLRATSSVIAQYLWPSPGHQ
jgi:hypothetical protein